MDYIVNEISSSKFSFPSRLNKGDRLILNYVECPIPVKLCPGKYLVEVFGAGSSGLGGYARGILNLVEPSTFYAYIGGNGSRGTTWNGGGVGYNTTCYGGGATDLRLIDGDWNNINSLRSRIIVAGGGGGFGGRGTGGDGGGLTGGNGSSSGYGTAGTGGTQTSGGTGGTGGKFGIGGNRTGVGGGGGGGGYYGGGGTSADTSGFDDKGAGGGSGFISGHPGCNAIDKNGNHTGQPNHYSGLIFTDTELVTGSNPGDGKIIITFVEEISSVDIDYFSEQQIWEGTKGTVDVKFKAYIKDYNGNNTGGLCDVIVNDETIVSGVLFDPDQLIPFSIDKSKLTEEINLLKISLYTTEGELNSTFVYEIIKENRDTFTFKRVFDFKEDYITDENIEVIYGRGLTLKEIGRGEVNIEIPTEGKSKISNIVIEGGEDKEEELIIEREMTYLNDLGEGKVYKSRLLTEYSDITNIVYSGMMISFDPNTSYNIDLSNNNKTATNKSNSNVKISKPKIEGRWVLELIINNMGSGITVGVGDSTLRTEYPGIDANSYGWNLHNGYWWHKGSSSTTVNPNFSSGDVCGICLDLDNKEISFYKNGSFLVKKGFDLDGYIYFEIGSGTASGTTVTLLTDRTELIYNSFYPDGYLPYNYIMSSLIKSNNKYYTYQDNEFIEVEPTVENFKEKSINLSLLTTPTDKVVLTMEGGEKLEDGRLYRKTIDISKYGEIERVEVK